MTPTDFLTLAIQLVAGSQECEWRSAVSRAYYSAFHVSRDELSKCGIELPADANAHQKVGSFLASSANSDISAAGTKLLSLRKKRNDADYKLSASVGRKHAAVGVAIAEEIIKAVRGQHANEDFRNAMRNLASISQLPITKE